MSLHDSSEKINPVKDREGSQRPSVFNGVKQFVESDTGKDILTVVIVILVGFGSFELGRLSKANSSSGIQIEYLGSQTANILSAGPDATRPSSKDTTSADVTGKNFFASSRGSKYYSAGCSAGKTIKQANRVYFATSEEAETAGYTLSSSCN